MPTSRAAAILLTAIAGFLPALPAAELTPIRVQLGQEVARPWDQVVKDGWVYGAQQTYDEDKHETRVFLPYGDNPLMKAGTVNTVLANAAAEAQAEAATVDNTHVMRLSYRLEFDRPITAFRCLMGPYSEVVLAPTCIAGVEFSADGTTWFPVGQPQKGVRALVNPLVAETNVVGGLNTRLLLLRIYTRDGAHPTSSTGPEMYLKMRISGNPGWGDAAQTFANAQNQVWVTSLE